MEQSSQWCCSYTHEWFAAEMCGSVIRSIRTRTRTRNRTRTRTRSALSWYLENTDFKSTRILEARLIVCLFVFRAVIVWNCWCPWATATTHHQVGRILVCLQRKILKSWQWTSRTLVLKALKKHYLPSSSYSEPWVSSTSSISVNQTHKWIRKYYYGIFFVRYIGYI